MGIPNTPYQNDQAAEQARVQEAERAKAQAAPNPQYHNQQYPNPNQDAAERVRVAEQTRLAGQAPNTVAADKAAADKAAADKLAADKAQAQARAEAEKPPKEWIDETGMSRPVSANAIVGTRSNTNLGTVVFDVTKLVKKGKRVSFVVGMNFASIGHSPNFASRHYKALDGPKLHILTKGGGTFDPPCVADAVGRDEVFGLPAVIRFNTDMDNQSVKQNYAPHAGEGGFSGEVVTATLTLTIAAVHGDVGTLYVDSVE